VAEREILQLGNPILWQVSAAVDRPLSEETRTLIRDLSDTLAAFRRSHGCGRGIAAPQVGVLERVLFVRMPDGFCGALINPVIDRADQQLIELWDGCFSFPDLCVRVARSRSIDVSYIDQDGTSRSLAAVDDLSELLQHEIDHLDGILAVQRATSPASFMTRAEWERQGSPP